MRRKGISLILCLILSACFLFASCGNLPTDDDSNPPSSSTQNTDENLSYKGETYTVLNDNKPSFKDSEITEKSFEKYSELDGLGRCGVAEACVGVDIMPTEERGSIGQVKPSGWHTVKYDIVDGKYLYNRCHLIGYQLTGENANTKNLITGTRFFNVEGMLPFENMVADYVKETENHVMYRVTPVYDGNNLVAKGVQMEAYSVEDNGEGICFNVFVHNVQPGVIIDYKTGESRLDNSSDNTVSSEVNKSYILNTNTKKFHLSSCGHAKDIKPENKKETDKTRDSLILDGYTPCKTCNP